MAQIHVITRSFSLPPEMLKWIDDFGKQTNRTRSQVVQFAMQLLMNKISVNQEGVVQ